MNGIGMNGIARLLHRRRDRRRLAALRLRAARARFERSSTNLRRAAFDHIDGHLLVATILQATLARLAAQGAGA